MKKIQPYQYHTRPVAAPEYNTTENVQRIGSAEMLTGVVQGMKASDLEERVAKALDKVESEYQFRVRVTSDALGPRKLTEQFANIKGEIEIDFLVNRGGETVPIFVDGQIAHFMTPWQIDIDKEKADSVTAFGKRLGWRESVRIPFWEIHDQDSTDRRIQALFP